jgi:hypothetical protein
VFLQPLLLFLIKTLKVDMNKTKTEIKDKMQHTTKRRISIGLLLICLCLPASAQQLTQNIRGIVTDKASGTPIAYATIQVEDAPDRGAITDSLGNFLLKGIPLGRHSVKATFVGYAPSLIREILVSSAKETFLEIAMTENTQELGEVVIRPQVNKRSIKWH